MHFIVVIDPGY